MPKFDRNCYFSGLIVAKVVSSYDFWYYLVALSSDFCYSNPLLYLFSSIFNLNKGLLKRPFFVIFRLMVK